MTVLGITGSTGALGRLVARALSERGLEQRLLVRDPARAPGLAGASLARTSYADPKLARASLQGVSILFMVSGAEAEDRLEQHRTFLDAAADAGVEHVVYTSFLGAAADCTFTLGRDHWATEEHVRALGLGHTFLRDSFYLDFLPELVGEDGVIRGPAGDGRVAAVTRADIARSAVAVLTDPAAHRDRTYDLTGPEALSFDEVAALLTAHTGRTVTYHDESVEEAYASRLRWPAPQWQYDAWVSTYTAIAAGELSTVTDHVQRLTGRAPTGLASYLTEEGR